MGAIAAATIVMGGATMIAANQNRQSPSDLRRSARGDVRMALDEWLRTLRAVKSGNVSRGEDLTKQLQARAKKDLALGTELDDITMNRTIQQVRMAAAQRGMEFGGREFVQEAIATTGMGQQLYQQRIANAGMAAQLGQQEMQYLLSGAPGANQFMSQQNMYGGLALQNQAATGQAIGSAFNMWADLYSARQYNQTLLGMRQPPAGQGGTPGTMQTQGSPQTPQQGPQYGPQYDPGQTPYGQSGGGTNG